MQNEKDLYVIRDYDNNYIYVVKANSREMVMDLVNAYTGLNKEDWIVDLADNESGEIIE